MELFVIKGLYLAVGLLGGYIVGRKFVDSMEKRLHRAIFSGAKVMIVINDSVIKYELIGDKLQVSMGTLAIEETNVDNESDLGSGGTL